MKEIVSLHIGQAGNQVGFAIWELLCAEHGIGCDGRDSGEMEATDRSFETFFHESHAGLFVPRGLFIDLEPSVINQLRKGSYAGLYHPMQLISGNDDSSSNFARAFYTVGRLLYHRIENQLRKQIEACDYIQILMLHRSLAGGAGSGLTSMVFEILEQYSKTIRLEFPIHPAPHFDSSVIGPYNSILAEHFCLDECDIGLLLDNEALFDICTKVLEIKKPTMTTINRILGQVCSSITAATRFNNDLFNDLTVALTNLVPYPRIHFPLVSFAPLGNVKNIEHEENTIIGMTKAVFEASNQLVKCDPSSGKYMSCSLVYRGLISPSEVYSTLAQIKNSRMIRFVDWCPTGFKIGIVDQPPLILPQSLLGETKTNVVMMTNSSSVSAIWQRLAQKFHTLYSKRSFVHWFVGEGLEESEFCEALYNLATLAKDYEEVSLDSNVLKHQGEKEAKELEDMNEDGEHVVPNLIVSQSEKETKTTEDSSEEESNESNRNKNDKNKNAYSHLSDKKKGERKSSLLTETLRCIKASTTSAEYQDKHKSIEEVQTIANVETSWSGNEEVQFTALSKDSSESHKTQIHHLVKVSLHPAPYKVNTSPNTNSNNVMLKGNTSGLLCDTDLDEDALLQSLITLTSSLYL